MRNLSSKVIETLRGKTLVTAESLTGGGIGAALTAVPGASEVYKGGVISYTNEVKHHVLGVDTEVLESVGAVSEPVAREMAAGARNLLKADVAVSVTGLAGPGGDEFGTPVGTVFIGYADKNGASWTRREFDGGREQIRQHTAAAALQMVLDQNA